MSAHVDRHFLRLSEKAAKLRKLNCPKFDIRASDPLDDEDKGKLTQLSHAAGWNSVNFRQDGLDHVAEFRMPEDLEVDPNAIRYAVAYC